MHTQEDPMFVAKDAASLFQWLDKQAALFEQWLALEERKTEAVIGRCVADLQQIVTDETELLRELDRLEGERIQAVRELVPAGSLPTLTQLADGFDEPNREACLERHARLSELASLVQERHRLNSQLIRQAGTFNAVLLEAFVGGPDRTTTYGPPGAKKESASGPAVPAGKAAMVDWQA